MVFRAGCLRSGAGAGAAGIVLSAGGAGARGGVASGVISLGAWLSSGGETGSADLTSSCAEPTVQSDKVMKTITGAEARKRTSECVSAGRLRNHVVHAMRGITSGIRKY